MGNNITNTKASSTFAELVRLVYFSVPMRPLWGGLILMIGLFVMIGQSAKDAMTIVLELSVCLSGLLSIWRREFPLWHRMATGPIAVFFGWLSLILGASLLIHDLFRLIFR